MTRSDRNDQLRLGFLTAVEDKEIGFVGALLVTSQRGRPLEFQCTTPVKPNRTQEILYGPTLAGFLLGDLIGRTLVERVGVKPQVILVDRPEFFELRSQIDIPVCHVTEFEAAPKDVPEDSSTDASDESSSDSPAVIESSTSDSDGSVSQERQPTRDLLDVVEPASPEYRSAPIPATPTSARESLQLGRQLLRFDEAHADDRQIIERHARSIPGDVDLFEPFDRLRQALKETLAPGAKR